MRPDEAAAAAELMLNKALGIFERWVRAYEARTGAIVSELHQRELFFDQLGNTLGHIEEALIAVKPKPPEESP